MMWARHKPQYETCKLILWHRRSGTRRHVDGVEKRIPLRNKRVSTESFRILVPKFS
nr:MAG TPA: hypothetical protein [Caudoviricetes sp.]